MRPIDADALMEKLNGIWDCNDMTFEPVDGCCIDADCKSCRWRETIEYVKRLVQNQTTASPWRRVEEKPKEADQYFVIWENNGDRGGGAAWFSLRLGWIWGGPKITHWMPIELPQEENK